MTLSAAQHSRGAAGLALLLLAGTGLLVLLSAPPSPAAAPMLVCYYTTGEPLPPSQLAAAAALCSHIIVGFARVRDQRLALEPDQQMAIAGVVALRGQQPHLRVMVSVGGANGDSGFKDMVRDHKSRKTFIRSVRDALRNHSLDGIDLDWEFPGVEGARQRQHFSQLLRELRVEFSRHQRPPLLSVAAAAPEPIAAAAYDVSQLDQYVDWVGLMSYDYHVYSKMTPFTGHNAPLFARADELAYLRTLNGNHSAHWYLQRGLRPQRLALGVPVYGHSFTLVSAAGARVGSPARGPGVLGSGGFVSQQQLCAWMREHADAARHWDAQALVPFVTRGTEWVSYEEGRSVAAKAALVRRLRLAGAMVYCLNADDPLAACGGGSFPLTRALHAALHSPAPLPPDAAATRT